MKKFLKIILIILLVLIVAVVAGFLYLYTHGLSGITCNNGEPREGQIKIACVGDSITYGHGIKGWAKNNYPVRLQNLLGESYHVQSFGVSGRAVQDNSDQPYRALEHYQNSLAYDADIVIFMMGTNDSKPENWHGEEAFKAAMIDLLDSYGDAEIILCTPATSFFMEDSVAPLTNYDIQPEVADKIAEIVRDIAAERGCTLVDIHALTAENPQWFEADGVHPNNDGAAAIAKAAYEAITGTVN